MKDVPWVVLYKAANFSHNFFQVTIFELLIGYLVASIYSRSVIFLRISHHIPYEWLENHTFSEKYNFEL